MSSEQIAVRVPSDLLAELDRLVDGGVFASRAAAVRLGLEEVTASEHRRRVDESIVEGYRRCPPTETERRAAEASLKASVLEERC